SLVIFGTFAAVALLLAALGIYSVTSYAVTRRTPEIGIRMALGAHTSDVLGLVLRQEMKFVLIGMGLGLVSSLVLTRLMTTLLFGVSPTDPPTLVVISLFLATVALLACYIPARRATKIDPLMAIRNE